jgi:hypothetical protein
MLEPFRRPRLQAVARPVLLRRPARAPRHHHYFLQDVRDHYCDVHLLDYQHPRPFSD